MMVTFLEDHEKPKEFKTGEELFRLKDDPSNQFDLILRRDNFININTYLIAYQRRDIYDLRIATKLF